jgi:hypothetical protein
LVRVADLIIARFQNYVMISVSVRTHPPNPLLLEREGGEKLPSLSRRRAGGEFLLCYKPHTEFPKSACPTTGQAGKLFYPQPLNEKKGNCFIEFF